MPATPAADATSAQALAQQVQALRDPDSLVRIASAVARAMQSLAEHDRQRVLAAVTPAQAASPSGPAAETLRRERADEALLRRYAHDPAAYSAAVEFCAQHAQLEQRGMTRLTRETYVGHMLQLEGLV